MPGHTDGSASSQRVTKQTKKKMGMLKKIVRKGFRRMGRLVMKGGRGNNQYISYICEIYTKLNRFN